MPYTHTIKDRIVHITWEGIVSKEDLQSIGKLMPRLSGELGFAPDVLHTFDAVTGYGFPPIAAYMLSLLRKRVAIPIPVRSAVVVKTKEAKGLAAVFKALNRSPNLTMELFDNEESALRWIAEK